VIIKEETISYYGLDLALFINGVIRIDTDTYVSNNPSNPIFVRWEVKEDNSIYIDFHATREKYNISPEYIDKYHKLLRETIEKLNLVQSPLPKKHRKIINGFNPNKINTLGNNVLHVEGLDLDRLLYTLSSDSERNVIDGVNVIRLGGLINKIKPYTTRQLIGLEHIPVRSGKIIKIKRRR